jgi:alkylation response protein AidB-like acyl-CoA dehydrogenase
MDFTFDATQLELQETARRFLEAEVPPHRLRELVESPEGTTDHLWSQMVGLGWTALLAGERHGGAKAGLLEACVVAEQMGRIPLPGPYFSSAVAATLACRALGAEDLLSDLAAGRARGTVACQEAAGGDPIASVRSRARRRGTGWVVSGDKTLVLDGVSADWVLVVARADDELRTFLLEGAQLEAVPTLDPTRKAARLHLDVASVEPVGPSGGHGAIWRRVLDDASVVLASESVGTAHRALDEAISYTSQRVVFDRPVASFQVVKHRIVDMFQALEMARVGVHFAAWASDSSAKERERAAAMAAGYATEMAVKVTGDNVQLHGGTGFTWENDAHFLFKRAKMNQVLVGGTGFELQRLEEMLISPLGSELAR